eukprot:4901831-Alexandrium_andersonii.AAC.2
MSCMPMADMPQGEVRTFPRTPFGAPSRQPALRGGEHACAQQLGAPRSDIPSCPLGKLSSTGRRSLGGSPGGG